MTNCCHCSGVTPPPPPPSGACCSFDFEKASDGYGSDSWDLKSCENAVYQSDCDSRRYGKHFPGQECDDVWPEECGVDNRGYCCNGSVSGVEGVISVSGNNYTTWYDHPGGITFCGGPAGTEKVNRLFFSPGGANCDSQYGEGRFSAKWMHTYEYDFSSEIRVPYIINTDAIPEGRCSLNAHESGVYFCLGPSEGVGNTNSSDDKTSKHEWENETTIGVNFDYFNLVESCDDPACGTDDTPPTTTTAEPPTGSCCVLQSDGTFQCLDGFTSEQCAAYGTGQGNIYRAGQNCEEPCPAPTGACCVGQLYSCGSSSLGSSATCLSYTCNDGWTEAECDAEPGFNNIWNAGKVCSLEPCPPTGVWTTTTTVAPTTTTTEDPSERGCCISEFGEETCLDMHPDMCDALSGRTLAQSCSAYGSSPCNTTTTTTQEPLGRCCYGSIVAPYPNCVSVQECNCAVTTEFDCLTNYMDEGGTWFAGADCFDAENEQENACNTLATTTTTEDPCGPGTLCEWRCVNGEWVPISNTCGDCGGCACPPEDIYQSNPCVENAYGPVQCGEDERCKTTTTTTTTAEGPCGSAGVPPCGDNCSVSSATCCLPDGSTLIIDCTEGCCCCCPDGTTKQGSSGECLGSDDTTSPPGDSGGGGGSTGSCCHVEDGIGVCSETTEAECDALSGSFESCVSPPCCANRWCSGGGGGGTSTTAGAGGGGGGGGGGGAGGDGGDGDGGGDGGGDGEEDSSGTTTTADPDSTTTTTADPDATTTTTGDPTGTGACCGCKCGRYGDAGRGDVVGLGAGTGSTAQCQARFADSPYHYYSFHAAANVNTGLENHQYCESQHNDSVCGSICPTTTTTTTAASTTTTAASTTTTAAPTTTTTTTAAPTTTTSPAPGGLGGGGGGYGP